MPTATEITETVQDGIMKVVETSQRLTLEALGAAVSTIDGFLPEMPKMPFAKSMPSPKTALDSSFKFAERMMASQKSFLTEMATLTEPVTAAPAKKTA